MRELFGQSLYSAAVGLVEGGGVREVRVLQGGTVITGVVGKHRVYVRRPAGNARLEGECNCNEHNPCVHVAAVVIAAAQNTATPTPTTQHPGPRQDPGQQQRLLYLLGPGPRVSVWVGQGNSLQPFEIRSSLGSGAFPRYVTPIDKEILQAPGTPSLRQVIGTGRAYWQAVQGQPLRAGAPLRADFAWQALPNGDQELHCVVAASVHVFLDLEPPLYIDSANATAGDLQTSLPLDLVRRYWRQPPVPPEDVAATNERIAPFPALQVFTIHRHPLSTLTPRLVLEAGPQATLEFVYNGLPVDANRLKDAHAAVRQMLDGSLYEIPRDLEREQQWRARLPALPDSREAWLDFVLNTAEALRAEGWEITTTTDFPYRIANADEWYGDLENESSKQGWFNLRLGIVVNGRHINLLPALARYLQTTLAGGDQASFESAEVAAGNVGCRVGDQWLILLDDGRYLPVAIERIQRIANTLVELLDRDGLSAQQTLTLPRSHTGRIAQLARELNGPTLHSNDATLRALLDDLDTSGGITPLQAPGGFGATLRPYQEEGLGWLQFLRRHGLGGILADDMGLGKTVQTLAHLVLEKQQGRLTRPALIVAPVSTLGNWQHEVHRFAPELRVLLLHGSRRKESFSLINKVDVVITGYSLLQLDSEVLLEHDYSLVILDEAQTIKNPRATPDTLARGFLMVCASSRMTSE